MGGDLSSWLLLSFILHFFSILTWFCLSVRGRTPYTELSQRACGLNVIIWFLGNQRSIYFSSCAWPQTHNPKGLSDSKKEVRGKDGGEVEAEVTSHCLSRSPPRLFHTAFLVIVTKTRHTGVYRRGLPCRDSNSSEKPWFCQRGKREWLLEDYEATIQSQRTREQGTMMDKGWQQVRGDRG